MSHFIVSVKCAKMAGGKYARIAVLEVENGVEEVKMISSRARGVIRIVETWERVHVGATSACAFQRALNAAKDICAQLNAAKAAEVEVAA